MPFKVLFLKFAGPLLIYAQNFKLLSSRSFIKEEKEEKQKQVRTFFYLNVLSCFEHLTWKLHIVLVLVPRKKKELPQQTDPPSIPVVDLFPSGEFPEGEIQQYKDEWVFVIFLDYNFFYLLQLYLILFLRWSLFCGILFQLWRI